MAQPRTETIQTVWDCKWSYLGYRASTRVGDEQGTEPLWLCNRRGNVARVVSERECATCPFWESVPKA